MALLPSHLPFLYCMMCYRSERSNFRQRTNVERLLNFLGNQSYNHSSFSGYEINSKERLDNILTRITSESSQRNQAQESFDLSNNDKDWIWHEENGNLDELCRRRDNNKNRQSIEQTTRKTDSNVGFGGFHQSENQHTQKLASNPPVNSNKNNHCYTSHPRDVKELLPNRFLTVEQLKSLLPRHNPIQPKRHNTRPNVQPLRRYTVDNGHHQDVKFFSHSHCSACYTEIGYEILSQVTDLQGENHTVLNFHNAFQFIAAGRCMNENSPCGGGGQARCTQIYRAHWTLVWTSGQGTQLVAHEVPSHCECVNVGTRSISTQQPWRDLKKPFPVLPLGDA